MQRNSWTHGPFVIWKGRTANLHLHLSCSFKALVLWKNSFRQVSIENRPKPVEDSGQSTLVQKHWVQPVVCILMQLCGTCVQTRLDSSLIKSHESTNYTNYKVRQLIDRTVWFKHIISPLSTVTKLSTNLDPWGLRCIQVVQNISKWACPVGFLRFSSWKFPKKFMDT